MTETVAEIIGDEKPVATEPKRVTPPKLPGHPDFPEPGIYFGMPDEVYHSIHACSATGLKHLSVSSMDYWALSPLNHERETEDDKKQKFVGKTLGRAYHVRICEGMEEYAKRYAVELDIDDARMAAAAHEKPLCVTVKDIRAAIEALDAKPKGVAKDALIEQLLDLDPEAFIWDRMVERHAKENEGRTLIPPKYYRRIEIAWAMIMGDPNLKGAFANGYAEVAIFWHDPATGAPMKAKLDFLKLNHIIDLKSFANPSGKPVQRAIDMAISNHKYFIPVVVYLEAVAAAKRMIKEQGEKAVRLVVMPEKDDGQRTPYYEEASRGSDLFKWCWIMAHQPEPEVLFIFQQTGIAPVTRGRIMPKGAAFTVTDYAVQHLKKKWVRCATGFGTDPWIDIEPIVRTEDESLTFAATDFGEQA